MPWFGATMMSSRKIIFRAFLCETWYQWENQFMSWLKTTNLNASIKNIKKLNWNFARSRTVNHILVLIWAALLAWLERNHCEIFLLLIRMASSRRQTKVASGWYIPKVIMLASWIWYVIWTNPQRYNTNQINLQIHISDNDRSSNHIMIITKHFIFSKYNF